MKKLVSESLNEYMESEPKPVFKGEKLTGLTVDDVEPDEFLVGMAVEAMHSSDIVVQKSLVLQNLSQNPKFYSEGMKDGLFTDPKAINVYKKYFIDKKQEEKEEKFKEKTQEAPEELDLNL
jgi:hypothetical protein